MATSFTDACDALASCVDNGVASTDTRVAKRVNEAQRRLIDQYNFLVRREELQSTQLVYAPNPTNLIFDNIDATKVMILSLWREENNELEMAAVLEKKAIDMVERDILQAVETDRRGKYQTLEAGTTTPYNTLGGLVGRLGLEIIPRYRIAPDRMRSYVRASYRMAVDHHNYIVRRESLHLPAITDNTLPFDSSELKISPEIIRELVINQVTQDNT
jgi:hypothetical protein